MRITNKIILLISALLAPIAISAQNHYEPNIAIGAKGGYTMSKLAFNPSVPQNMQGGLILGATFRYAEEKNFGLIAEFNIEQRGWKEKYEDQLTLPIKNKFDYGISAGAGVEWIMNRKHSFNLEGRFYYGLNNVFSSKKTDPFSGSNSMSIMLTLGYYYRIK